jgi:hypothetical protein
VFVILLQEGVFCIIGERMVLITMIVDKLR